MKKVIHVIFSMDMGGAQTMLVDIINEQSLYLDVKLIIINNEYDAHLLKSIDPKIKIFYINRPKGSKNIYYFLKVYFTLMLNNIDVIHCHDCNIIKIIPYHLRKITYLTVHDVGLNTNYLHKFKKVFSISESVKRDIIDRCSKVEVHTVYNGLNLTKIKNTTSPTKNSLKIVQISRLEHMKKGQHLLINAISIILEHLDKSIVIKCDFIGDGSSYEYLSSLVSEKDLCKNVIFLLRKDRDYIYENLSNYDILIQPSFFEGFGLTIIEAMAARVPVICSNIEGPSEIIGQRYGFTFEKGDELDLANKILQVINLIGTPKLENLKNLAFDYVNENYSISNTSKKYLIHYFSNK